MTSPVGDLPPTGHWYLGRDGDGNPVHLPSDDLTTHGVIVGMTGSGKTGLGIIALEEALLSGVPAIVIDPKGDLGNLALVFPDLTEDDFAPWVDPVAAEREGKAVTEAAAAVAELWRAGLERSGIGRDRLTALATGAEVTVYTPGSTAGVPLDVLGSLSGPTDRDDLEGIRAEALSITSSVLLLAGITADPLSSPEHILVATVIEHAWSAGEHLDLPTLIGRVQQPPMRKLGVFELDQFLPPKERTALALRLNGLVASPSFATWLTGEPLDIDHLTRTPDGRPRAAIISLAHLGDAERQFAVTVVLAKVVSWMRHQPGTSALRLLVYMDEMFGFAPPTAQPPSKTPILTMLKQARAHGVGLLLATQNPMDLDYKAIANAGTWMVGRLQTERDKARIVEGLRSASGATDLTSVGDVIGGLEGRQFLLHSASGRPPTIFGTRWAMSYLAGPMSRPQLEQLTARRGAPPTSPATATPIPPASATPALPSLEDDETTVAPAVAGTVHHVDPAAPWIATVGGDPHGPRLVAGVAARVRLTFAHRTSGVDHTEEWEAVAVPAPTGHADWVPVDHDDRDFIGSPPAGSRYVLSDAPLADAAYLRGIKTALVDHLVATEDLEVLHNPGLKLYSRVGEDRAAFTERCLAAAEAAADADLAKLQARFLTRRRAAEERLRTAEARSAEAWGRAGSARQEEVLGAAGDLLGSLLGGRGNSTALRRMARRRSAATTAATKGSAADAQVEARMQDLLTLDEEARQAILEVTEAWEATAGHIEPASIGLVKSRVDVEDLMVVWVPFADG